MYIYVDIHTYTYICVCTYPLIHYQILTASGQIAEEKHPEAHLSSRSHKHLLELVLEGKVESLPSPIPPFTSLDV